MKKHLYMAACIIFSNVEVPTGAGKECTAIRENRKFIGVVEIWQPATRLSIPIQKIRQDVHPEEARITIRSLS
jgi:uncharacterized protein YuzE